MSDKKNHSAAPDETAALDDVVDAVVEVVDETAGAAPNVDADSIINGDGEEIPASDAAPEAAPETPAPANEPPVGDKPVDYREVALRTAAEFDNYRKRVARERRDWQRDSLARFLKEFFPAFDDLDRAIAESEKIAAAPAIIDGMKIARANLWKTLVGAGVKEIQAAEKPFDPRYHEAVAMLPFPNVPEGMIADVLQAGYLIDDFVLRPAKVVVAAAAPVHSNNTASMTGNE